MNLPTRLMLERVAKEMHETPPNEERVLAILGEMEAAKSAPGHDYLDRAVLNLWQTMIGVTCVQRLGPDLIGKLAALRSQAVQGVSSSGRRS